MDHGIDGKGFSILSMDLMRCLYFEYAGRHLIV